MEVSSRTKEDHINISVRVPSGDGPYVKAKHIQLVEKDPEGAIVWFWKAINEGDRVESALKDMAVAMRQLDRSEEAIEAIKSFRSLCPKTSQQSIDNLLMDLYKNTIFTCWIFIEQKCGKVDAQIALLRHKLRLIYKGQVFNGKPTKTARSHGKKILVSVRQETSRILGNLGWAYMQKSNFMTAEVIYKKAQMIDPDATKANNLAVCLIKQARYTEACLVLQQVLNGEIPGSNDIRARNMAQELLMEMETLLPTSEFLPGLSGLDLDDDFVNGLETLMNVWAPSRSKRLPIFEEIENFRDQITC
ncbi:putative tetratricopeptide-like helical domain superfamily [Helianthus annuus]|nr:putative tetratricopeptide-like helical domain superfamily [Helianthus annuus]KAJ0471838.1 putative tetratricopeptide-like helical domain superfamily [Helianthus annuus]KAJ0651323.1 putative tetratricopeptide-like helical domain superfamily [Helianthus annuus]